MGRREGFKAVGEGGHAGSKTGPGIIEGGGGASPDDPGVCFHGAPGQAGLAGRGEPTQDCVLGYIQPSLRD